ncbi:MAG TPA: 30S ribosomal protein S6 [Candidatus Paceibacterota bacterium]|nr:30S ribosomal protein S6 [Verrucomicrobiota bacterium]HRY47230.1 30S ribosomal protein S6 [Candidatus Paceibacterota bacterium]HSA02372.1 30S ribosomal protein S6 [Candidatus Paceibacterota bacterium]
MKRYEGLFILNTAGRDEGVKEAVDKISAEITNVGGKVETVQKMDRRPFARVSNKSMPAGFYVNVIFESQPQAIAQLRSVFTLREEIYRVVFTDAPPQKAATN